MMKSNKTTLSPFSPLDWMLAIIVGLASLGLYVRTLAPGPLPGDSGEFQVLAYQLGIAHCPGYPVYLWLAKLFTFLPIGDIAYRVNLFSACMAAITVAGVYLVSRLLSTGRLAAFFGALVLTVSFTFWSQAVIAEVYTAGAAFIVWILVCVLGWQRTGQAWCLFLAGLMGGLSLGVHTTVTLMAPGIVIFIWLHRQDYKNPWLPAITGVVSGVLLWAGAFAWIDWHDAPANIFYGAYETARSAWDLSPEDLRNPWTRIWFIATAQQWRSALKFDPGRMLAEFSRYLLKLPRELSVPGIIFSILGWTHLFRKRKDLAALFGVSVILQWAISFNYQIGDIYVFYIPGYVLLAITATLGLDWLGRSARKISPKAGPVFQGAITILAILSSVWLLLSPRWDSVRRAEVPFIGEEHYLIWEDPTLTNRAIAHTVEQLKPNTVLFLDWNWLYTYYYFAHVEQGRTDLRFIEPAPRADKPGLPDSVIVFIGANIDARPILFTRPFTEVESAGFEFRRAEIWFTNFYRVVRP